MRIKNSPARRAGLFAIGLFSLFQILFGFLILTEGERAYVKHQTFAQDQFQLRINSEFQLSSNTYAKQQ